MLKTSNLLFIVSIIILLLSAITYNLLRDNLFDNYNYSQQLVFNNIQRETNTLLNKLLYQYSKQKEILISKHQIVLQYLENKSYDDSLENIYKTINKNTKNNPYNIYITNDNLIIKNTTFKADLGFDLNFAKNIFEKHKQNSTIGISAPVFETFSSSFYSYTDSYLPKSKNSILQVSYKYNNISKELEKIQKLMNSNQNIFNTTAYIIFNDGYIGDFIFKSFKSYKPTLQEIKHRIQNGKKFLNQLNKNSSTTFVKNDKEYKLYYFLGQSALFDEAKIIYSVIFDETIFKQKIFNLNILASTLTLLFIIVMFIVYKIKKKEELLSYKDKFIEHSVHEIKTPLSVIKLNNQLRQKKLGNDKFSQKIEAAVKTLQNSYEDMTFLHTKSKISYDIETLDIAYHLKHRINFFNSIAKTQSKQIILDIKNNFKIKISKIELDRLIDNNLSNAIKYSTPSSNINVTLENSSLIFENYGEEIKDIHNIFKKYLRENKVQGGHGLGLSIVKSICDKYDILVTVKSKNGKNVFTYTFK